MRITVISGAGMSHASGIPTFRGKNGLWKKYSPSELANPSAFSKNPELVWEWYRWRINIILNAQPNSGHEILANIEHQGADITILTQNVDDLHERSGSKNVLHFHGEILYARCISCMNKFKWTEELLQNTELIPKCECGSFFRPDVVWFGESLQEEIIHKSLERIQQTTLLIVAGTSGVVYPVAEYPFIAKRNNPAIKIYEFNVEFTPISQIATHTELGPLEESLPHFFKDFTTQN